MHSNVSSSAAEHSKKKIENNVFMHSHKESDWHKAALCFNYIECLSRGVHRCHILKRTSHLTVSCQNVAVTHMHEVYSLWCRQCKSLETFLRRKGLPGRIKKKFLMY